MTDFSQSIVQEFRHMKAYQEIPSTYHEFGNIDLQKDRRAMLTVNGIGLAIMIVMVVGMSFFRPIRTLFDISRGLGPYTLRFVVLILGYIVYIVLHELTHACVMRLAGGRDVQFGFTGMYAYAGSEVDYFDRSAYFCIALAPLTVWFIVFLVIGSCMPPDWFWVLYLLQIGNVAGSAGDVYVTLRVLKMPGDTLIMDTGTRMTFLSQADREEALNQ